MLPISEFFRLAEARGPRPLKDHLNLTVFIDNAEAKTMRNRVIVALKSTKYRHHAGTTILNDGSTSTAFAGQTTVESTVPAPVRPDNAVVQACITEIVKADNFLLPSTSADIQDAGTAMNSLTGIKRQMVVQGFRKLNDERVLSNARHLEMQQREADKTTQLADARQDKQFLQQWILANGGTLVKP